MNKITDQDYLQNDQYHSAVNLNHRIALHERFSTNKTHWAEWIFQHLAVKEAHRVLAVGCGNATQWRENVGRYPQETQFVLMDLSVGMLSSARRGFSPLENRFMVVNGDAHFIPFPPAYFDRVTANHMLYHVPNIDWAVAECARVVKPSGLLMAATNGMNHMTDFYGLLSAFDAAFSPPNIAKRRFGLRNGAKYLLKHFHEVRSKLYNCDLWVTDAQALVNYAFSMWDVQDTIAMGKAKAMKEYFGERIKTEGGIRIRKETGIFLASKTPGLIDSIGIL